MASDEPERFHQVVDNAAVGQASNLEWDGLRLGGDIDGMWNTLARTVLAAGREQGLLAGPVAPRRWDSEATSEKRDERDAVRKHIAGLSEGHPELVALRLRFTLLDKQLSALRRKDSRDRRKALVEKILEAKRQRQWHAMWLLAKRLVSGRIGPRRRLYGQLPGSVVEIDEWIAQLQRDGPDGGCSARVLTRYRDAPSEDQLACVHSSLLEQAVRVPCDDDEEAAEGACALARGDLGNVGGWLAHRAKGRGIPAWSCPSPVWRLAFGATVLQKRMLDLLAAVRWTGRQPALWLASQLFPLAKHNGKAGPRGWRLIHLIDPISKAFAWGCMEESVDVSPYSYGFVAGRSREDAAIQLQATLHRLRAKGVGFLAEFWDASNAFPSMSHDALDEVCRKRQHGELLRARHRRWLHYIQGPQGDVALLSPGSGNNQGDTTAPFLFRDAYDGPTDKIVGSQVSLRDCAELEVVPRLGASACCLSHCRFADPLPPPLWWPRRRPGFTGKLWENCANPSTSDRMATKSKISFGFPMNMARRSVRILMQASLSRAQHPQPSI
jgi:hypothetical protein